MANLVFLVADLALDLVVFLVQRGVGDRVRLQVVGHVRAHDHGLRGQVHFGLDGGILVDALFLGFTDQQFARVELVADGSAQFGGIGLALGQALLEHEVVKALRVQFLTFGGRGLGLGGCRLRLGGVLLGGLLSER